MSKKRLGVGDRVTIYRKVKKEYWIAWAMDKFVGDSGTIVIDDGDSLGICLDTDNADYWYFPKTSVKREVKA